LKVQSPDNSFFASDRGTFDISVCVITGEKFINNFFKLSLGVLVHVINNNYRFFVESSVLYLLHVWKSFQATVSFQVETEAALVSVLDARLQAIHVLLVVTETLGHLETTKCKSYVLYRCLLLKQTCCHIARS